MKSIKDYSVEYSTVRCFSDSNDYCVLLHNFQTFDLFDKDLNFVRELKIAANQEPRWFGELLYFIVGRNLYRYNFKLNDLLLCYVFDEYIQFDSSDRNGVQGMGEGDIENGMLALAGMKEDGTRDIFLFNLKTSTKSYVLNLQRDDATEITFMKNGRAHGFDNIYANPNGGVLVSWYASGKERYQGIEWYDEDMNFIRQLCTVNSHMDVAFLKGLVWCSSPDPVINSNSVYLVNEERSLFDIGWEYALHISCCGNKIAVSLNDPKGIAPFQLWKVYYDGSQELVNSYFGPYKGYESAQKASISKDGNRIARCRFDGQNYFADIFGLEEINNEPNKKVDITKLTTREFKLLLHGNGTWEMFEN